ncbi:MAG TPA: hypothetical protein PKE66_00240 [Pyrinomonadaceae bacterium]|nr:hypothetical protein [Pyrinomonadaceae bacterium]
MVRKSTAIDALMPPVRQAVLTATYGDPDRWWYMSELAGFAGTIPSSLQRELVSLVEAKILRKRRDGARVYYQAETDSPLYEPLRMLIERTTGVVPALGRELGAFRSEIDAAFVYGSVARGDDNAGSDIDVILIGTIGIAKLAPVLRKLERRFHREFNVMCFSPAEFAAKRGENNHFIASVLKEKLLFLIGDTDVLERLGR